MPGASSEAPVGAAPTRPPAGLEAPSEKGSRRLVHWQRADPKGTQLRLRWLRAAPTAARMRRGARLNNARVVQPPSCCRVLPCTF